jgi:hypothetical protein
MSDTNRSLMDLCDRNDQASLLRAWVNRPVADGLTEQCLAA